MATETLDDNLHRLQDARAELEYRQIARSRQVRPAPAPPLSWPLSACVSSSRRPAQLFAAPEASRALA